MNRLIRKLDRKLAVLEDSTQDGSYKDINNPSYDRQVAEDALFHTIGPLTDEPRWTNEWTSKGPPVPGFAPGGPAPKWSKDEVIMAYAGDPRLLEGNTKDMPTSPKYGTAGGAPLYRQAMRQIRRFNRLGDFQALADAYNNGMFGLLSFMRKGKDQSRSPFISFAWRGVEGAITSGVGSSVEAIRAGAATSKAGTRGLKALLNVDSAEEARNIANQIQGEYQTTQSDDIAPENPFGVYSSRFYKVAMDYADAIEANDEGRMQSAEANIEALIEKIKDDSIAVRGIGTGSEQAISTPDRATSVAIKSIDAGKKGEDDARTHTLDIEEKSVPTGGIEPEAVHMVLQMCLEQDLGAAVGNIPRYNQMAIDAGSKVDKATGRADIGGRMTANELRYVIRMLGPIGLNYPGEGKVRTNLQIVRDAPGWWRAGEDPEIEPIPSTGNMWSSIWKRSGAPTMGPTEIAAEMTQEVRDLNSNGIATMRTVKSKVLPDGSVKEEAITKVAVHAAMTKAYVKLKLAAYLWKLEHDEDEIEESLKQRIFGNTLVIKESVDVIDRKLINEAYDYVIRRMRNCLLGDYAINNVL